MIEDHNSFPRRPRFRRSWTTSIRLTPDDVVILDAVARHRFLSSRHIQRLLPSRSGKKLIERLAELYHAGYLDRPKAQLIYFATAGSEPLVYALGNHGARLLVEGGQRKEVNVDWTTKNRSVGRHFIAHALAIADLMVGLEGQGDQLLKYRPVKKMSVLIEDRLLSVVPDAVFSLEETQRGRAKYFFVEADRATMPVTRSDLDQTSIRRKFLAYLAGGGRSNVFGQQLGIDNFRVLTLTTSAERIATMLALLKALTNGRGSRQFLFLERAALRSCADLLACQWLNGKGDPVRLLDDISRAERLRETRAEVNNAPRLCYDGRERPIT